MTQRAIKYKEKLGLIQTTVDADLLLLCGAPCSELSQGAGARSQTAVGRHAGCQFV